MISNAAASQTPLDDDELLSWENLAGQPATRAFRQSMVELIKRPRVFFRKMAVNGGLHEPLTFFAVMAGAAVLAAFPAALAYLGARMPDPASLSATEYSAHTLAARLTGILAVLLPIVLLAAVTVMVALSALFHLAATLFGAREWEGSASVWLYSCSAALAPVVLALLGIFAVSLAGYLVAIPWPAARAVTARLAHVASVALLSAGALVAIILLLRSATVGCTQAFALDATSGAAAGLAGTLLVAAAVGACVWGFVGAGFKHGITVAAACAVVAGALTAANAIRSRRPGRST